MFSSPDSSLRRFARLASSLVALALVGPANALPPTREDVPQVLRSLQDKDVAVSSQACYDVSEMAARKLFAPEDLPTLWEGLRPQLRSQHADSSELSARAVQALVRDSGLFTSAFWPGQEGTLRREPSQADRLAGQCLAGVLDESLLMLASDDRELQRRGANVANSLMTMVPTKMQEPLVRALLAIPLETAADGSATSPGVRCSSQVTSALIEAAPRIKAEALADDVAARLLEASRDRDMVTTQRLHLGLAGLAGATRGEVREQIVSAVIAAVADGNLMYSRTSGVLTPPKHRGADALAILAPTLTAEEVARAEKAIPPQQAGQEKEAYDSMYEEARKALAIRKVLLEQAAAPAEQVEEDVAFFEKRYNTKITGVKPKSEYADPDEFYSAIAKELGISDIAWQAAAERYGWKKDDGRNTFAMLKGGPTSEGGEGMWDVLFIRSTINPVTQKPEPGTIEQVMVQVDYDGRVTFPQIPAGLGNP